MLGGILMLFALAMLVPLAFACFGARRRAARPTTRRSLITFGLRRCCCSSPAGRYRRELQPRDGFLLVTLVWTVLPAFGALPLLLHIPGLSFTDAYFEAMSGLTTTGATVLTGLDTLPLSINVWRCFMVLIGGMGIIVLVVAILPLLGVGGSQLFKAETPGPMKDQKLTPRIAETARGLWAVYFVIAAGLLLRLPRGRHGLGRRLHAHVLDDGAGRLLRLRRQLRPLRLAGDRGGGDRLHAAGRRQLRALLRGLAQRSPARPLWRDAEARAVRRR